MRLLKKLLLVLTPLGAAALVAGGGTFLTAACAEATLGTGTPGAAAAPGLSAFPL